MSARKTYESSHPGKKKAYPVKKKRVKKKSGRWLWLWLGFTGLAMLSATAGAMLAVSLASMPLLQSQLSPEEAAIFGKGGSIARSSMRLPELTRPVNILILGTKVLTSDLNQQPDEDPGYHALVNSFDGLSDTMLLVRFDPEARKLAVLSVPRDTKTYVEGVGLTKINAANYHGGPALTAKATSELLEGVGIDRYIRVNVQGIEKLVDALGGVTVYVPKDMKYKDDSQHLYIDLKEGRQHLNGNQAMQFLRFRYDKYGDVGRVQRQQMLMRALMEQALNPTTLARMPKILSVIQSHLDTNLSVEELVALVGFGAQTKRSDVQMLMVPGRFSSDGHNEVSYWLPNHRQIEQMMAQHFDQGYSDQSDLDPGYLRVAIQDSTGEPEAVQALVNTLQEAGYRNVYVDESWKEPLRVTRIVAQQGDDTSAAAIRADLGFGEVRVESTGSLGSDVTIQLGQDWLKRQPSADEEEGFFSF
ncbi:MULTISPECIES: LCP family protein [unclassified Coleofasciculus]|uniref:LCP family protein n=1 Tax=unclassified Coleofasciculus TaxID=2692782 RepID=UPI001882EABF|nr:MULTISPECIES: LCP family protein [unclassified Coleofasciculus]MBE9128868.1 LCP family protein [Coleofasciculus sp. LEGE 07081]MBE9151628.1 LCP family protein [Coleofasciculus sp. LEGE 07092]